MKSATDSNTDGQTSINIVITLSVSNLYVSIYMDRDYEITWENSEVQNFDEEENKEQRSLMQDWR